MAERDTSERVTVPWDDRSEDTSMAEVMSQLATCARLPAGCTQPSNEVMRSIRVREFHGSQASITMCQLLARSRGLTPGEPGLP